MKDLYQRLKEARAAVTARKANGLSYKKEQEAMEKLQKEVLANPRKAVVQSLVDAVKGAKK